MKKLIIFLMFIFFFVLVIGSIVFWGFIGFSWLTSIVVLFVLVFGGMVGWSCGPKEVLVFGGVVFLSIFLVHVDWGNVVDFVF